jgi:hypothetical protein
MPGGGLHWIGTLTGSPPNSPPSSLANGQQPSTRSNRELLQSTKRAARRSARKPVEPVVAYVLP